MKLIASAISRSSAMLSDGFCSVADTGNERFLLRGAAVSRYAADVRHHFWRGAATRIFIEPESGQ